MPFIFKNIISLYNFNNGYYMVSFLLTLIKTAAVMTMRMDPSTHALPPKKTEWNN